MVKKIVRFAGKDNVKALSGPRRTFLPAAAADRPGRSAISAIRRGFGCAEIRDVQQAYQISDKPFAQLMGISDKTLSRIRKSNAKLSSLSGDRLYRLQKIWALANKVFETPGNALNWLRRAQPGLDNQAPLDLLDTEPGYEQIQTLLNQLEFGVLP